MSELVQGFSCAGCGRTYAWKEQLAGKRVKCKCGQVIVVPAGSPEAPQEPPPPEQPSEEDLYALAGGAGAAAKAPSAPVMATAVAPVAGAAIPLGYQRGPTAREIERSSSRVLIDPRRDYQVPIALLAIGAILYTSYYAIHYGLSPLGIMSISIGLAVMTVFEMAALIGFAFFIAKPLGVSFGGVGTAMLKLAAIAVFCDGLTTWVDGFVAKYSGGFGAGVFGYGVVGFPIALGAYWSLLIYLFDMDPGDSWMVVILLAIFYRILRIVLLLLLLKLILSLGGVAASAVSLPSVGAAPAAEETSLTEEIQDAKDRGLLCEARQFIQDTGRGMESPSVEKWYEAGCKNVWYRVTRDFDQKSMVYELVIELPTDKDARAKCYEIAKDWYEHFQIDYVPKSIKDTGEPYLEVPLSSPASAYRRH